MVSCIEIETASLVFASLSLISSSLGSLVPIAMMVYINVLIFLIGYLNETLPRQLFNINQLELGIGYYDLYFKVGVGFTLSIIQSFKMRSFIQIETASLVFASLSLLFTSLGSLACIAFLVHLNVIVVNLVRVFEMKLPSDYIELITTFIPLIHLVVTGLLAMLAVTFAFSIILTKGLISKKAHLVKAYFIYGVTLNTLSVIAHISLFATDDPYRFLSLWSLLGCFLYGLILLMIQKTYVKIANTECDQFSHKKLEEEKSNA